MRFARFSEVSHFPTIRSWTRHSNKIGGTDLTCVTMCPMRVYQFRDADIARKIVRERRLKISTFLEMNDPFELAGIGFKASEFRIVPPRYRAHLEQLFPNSVLPTLKEKVGAVCFSRAWHNPVLWAHYADKHRG